MKRLLALVLVMAYALVTWASVSVTVNGTSYTIPQTNERGWGTSVTSWIQAMSQYSLQPTGGTFALTNDVNFGANYGLKSKYFSTRDANPAGSGLLRLTKSDTIGWRNNANDGNLLLAIDASDRLTFGGVILPSATTGSFQDSTFNLYDNSDATKKIAFEASGITTGTTRTVTMPDANVNLGALTDSNIDASAAIAYSKLNLSGAIVDADLSNSAAISRLKLASGTASHVVINDGSGNLSSESTLAKSRGGSGQDNSSITFPASGTLATTGGTETFTNKSLTDPIINSAVMTNQGSSPTNPSAGSVKLYSKTDNKLYVLDSTGNETAVGTGSGGATNYIVNPSAASDASTGTSTSSATLTRDTDTSDAIDGKASFLCDTSANGGYCLFEASTILEGDKTGNCEASAIFKGDASLYSLRITDETNTLLDTPLTNASDWTEVRANYPCGSTRDIRLVQTTAGTSGAVNIGRIYWGKATNIGTVAQASLYGASSYAGTANCIWTTTSGSFANFTADSDCNTPTGVNNGSAPSTKIPGVTFSSLPAGDYLFVASDTAMSIASQTTDTVCGFRFSDGTDGFGSSYTTRVATDSLGGAVSSSIVARKTYSQAQSNITIQIQGVRSAGNGTCQLQANSSSTNLTIHAYRYPTQSELAVRPDTASWYVAGNISGENPDLGTSAVTSYTELTHGSLTLTPASGSAPVGIMCSSTNAAATPSTSATTCSAGNESVGFNLTVPRAGTYQACMAFSHYAAVGPDDEVISAFQLVETATNAQTILQQGGDRSYSGGGAGSGTFTSLNRVSPYYKCGLFYFSSPGTKGIRLMYEQFVTGTPLNSLIVADANPVLGNRDIYFTMRPWLQAMPSPLLTGSVTSNSAGMERVERVKFNCSSSSSITSQSGSWVSSVGNIASGACTVVFAAGAFSGSPVCNPTVTNIGAAQALSVGNSGATTSGVTVYGFGSSALTNYNVDMICMGPR